MEKHGVVAIDDVGITPVMALRTRFTPIQWLVCLVAAIGFAFDIDEVVILPLVLRPAFASLRKLSAGTREFNLWAGMFFFIPAEAGGIFGLLGGWLADLFGRRRILLWSIPVYGLSACAAAYAAALPQFLILRCTTLTLAITQLANVMPQANAAAKLACSVGTVAVLV